MKSHEHASIGAVAAAAALFVLRRSSSLLSNALLWTYGVFLSVFIDLDHFVIARWKAGDWSHLREAATDPVWAFTEQEEVFPDLRFPVERLLTHALIGGVLTLLWLPVSAAAAVFTAVVVYAHVVADMLRETGLA